MEVVWANVLQDITIIIRSVRLVCMDAWVASIAALAHFAILVISTMESAWNFVLLAGSITRTLLSLFVNNAFLVASSVRYKQISVLYAGMDFFCIFTHAWQHVLLELIKTSRPILAILANRLAKHAKTVIHALLASMGTSCMLRNQAINASKDRLARTASTWISSATYACINVLMALMSILIDTLATNLALLLSFSCAKI